MAIVDERRTLEETSMESEPQRIDVHHHLLPDDYVRSLAALGVADGGGIPFPKWRVESALSLGGPSSSSIPRYP
jgi:hypothetical protein